MSVRKKQINKNTFYFITITCHKWIHLFDITNLYGHIYKWFDYLKTKKVLVTGYVIMPNHLHLLVYTGNTDKVINTIIGNGKRFMSYEIVNRLKETRKTKLLSTLHNSTTTAEKIKGKIHTVFEPSFDIKEITTEKFIVQKLNYIHQNPVRGKWHLVDDYREFKYSSAGFYESGDTSGYKVIHYEIAGSYFSSLKE